MPTYEYQCDPCRTIYQARHGVNDPAPVACPRCGGPVARRFSPPNLKLAHHTSPTAAKYARMSKSEEIARERELQKNFESLWLPSGVVDDPWSG